MRWGVHDRLTSSASRTAIVAVASDAARFPLPSTGRSWSAICNCRARDHAVPARRRHARPPRAYGFSWRPSSRSRCSLWPRHGLQVRQVLLIVGRGVVPTSSCMTAPDQPHLVVAGEIWGLARAPTIPIDLSGLRHGIRTASPRSGSLILMTGTDGATLGWRRLSTVPRSGAGVRLVSTSCGTRHGSRIQDFRHPSGCRSTAYRGNPCAGHAWQ